MQMQAISTCTNTRTLPTFKNLSIMTVEITIYDIVHWITQYFNDFNHKFDGNKSNNDRKYHFNGNVEVSILMDCILMCMMSVIDK